MRDLFEILACAANSAWVMGTNPQLRSQMRLYRSQRIAIS